MIVWQCEQLWNGGSGGGSDGGCGNGSEICWIYLTFMWCIVIWMIACPYVSIWPSVCLYVCLPTCCLPVRVCIPFLSMPSSLLPSLTLPSFLPYPYITIHITLPSLPFLPSPLSVNLPHPPLPPLPSLPVISHSLPPPSFPTMITFLVCHFF